MFPPSMFLVISSAKVVIMIPAEESLQVELKTNWSVSKVSPPSAVILIWMLNYEAISSFKANLIYPS